MHVPWLHERLLKSPRNSSDKRQSVIHEKNRTKGGSSGNFRNCQKQHERVETCSKAISVGHRASLIVIAQITRLNVPCNPCPYSLRQIKNSGEAPSISVMHLLLVPLLFIKQFRRNTTNCNNKAGKGNSDMFWRPSFVNSRATMLWEASIVRRIIPVVAGYWSRYTHFCSRTTLIIQ